ncbi:MAG: hypothetical protein JJE08_00225 [Proteiniphilum sp.]|nr:hypothetical protein [Proteiniphilum sp.]
MIKRVLLLISVAVTILWSCEEKAGDPQIIFENGLDSISEIFPGDLFYVKGKIMTDEPLSGAFYFHQKIDETGKLDESGDRLELGVDGSADSFTLGFLAEPTTVGVKIIAEDVNGNRSVRIFKVIQGVDGLEITLDDPGFIDDIESGVTFHVKGSVTSKTKITSLNYRIIKGDITEGPVSVDLTGEQESNFDIPLIARNGMTGVMVTAVNRGELTVSRLFEIKHVTAVGPVIIYDNEMIEVKPDSTFTVSGRVTSNLTVTSLSYVIVRGGGSDPAQTIALSDNRFSFDVDAGEDVTSVVVTAIDSNGNEGLQSLPVTILFPGATVGDVMIHYKYIILTDEKYPKSYFSFSMAPYVLDGTLAKANQSSVNLMYTNCYISDGHASNGPAIFGPNVSKASTIKANDLVEEWSTPYNLTRLPSASDFFSTVGKTFDEIGDNQEDWELVDTYVKNKIGGSSVVRQSNMSEGYMFAIGFGGTTAGEINKYAIAIVRGLGGEKATSAGESTGAWVEIEIKIRK